MKRGNLVSSLLIDCGKEDGEITDQAPGFFSATFLIASSIVPTNMSVYNLLEFLRHPEKYEGDSECLG